MSSIYRKKVFPLRLPQSYHGQVNKKPLRQQYRQRSQMTRDPTSEGTQKKIVNWQLKRRNNDIINQRRQYLTHTGKVSHDTPAWFRSTADFYHRNQHNKLKLIQYQSNQHSCDVLNQKRFSLSQWRMNSVDQKNHQGRWNSIMDSRKSSMNVTGKIGQEGREGGYSLVATAGVNYRRDVTSKIGSVDFRNYNLKKSQLKVGKSDIVDTYSPF